VTITHGSISYGNLEAGATVTSVAYLMGSEVMFVGQLAAGVALTGQAASVQAPSGGAATVTHG
jgi:hypothetical protein